MKILDSSFCADFLRGYEHAKRYRLDHSDEPLVLPSIGFYELYHGAIRVGRDPIVVEEDLPWVERLEYTREHAREAAAIRTELESRGERIQHPDMMLAGVARSLETPLVTSDDDFERVDDLAVENPRSMYE